MKRKKEERPRILRMAQIKESRIHVIRAIRGRFHSSFEEDENYGEFEHTKGERSSAEYSRVSLAEGAGQAVARSTWFWHAVARGDTR